MDLIRIGTEEDYARALRQLYPRGSFWDKQWADENSDLSLLCAAKAKEIRRFKLRRQALLRNAYPATSDELIDNWERLFDQDNSDLQLEDRQALAGLAFMFPLSKNMIELVIGAFGGTLRKMEPIAPAWFGYTRFGSRFGGLGTLVSVRLLVSGLASEKKARLESVLERIFPEGQVVVVEYEGES